MKAQICRLSLLSEESRNWHMSRKMKRVAQEEIRQFRGSCYRRKTRSCRWKRVSPSILCVAEHEEGRVSPLISWRRITQPLTAAMRRFEGKLWSLLIVHLGRRIVISHSLCFFFISKLNFLQKNQVFFLSVWVHRRSDTIQKLEG